MTSILLLQFEGTCQVIAIFKLIISVNELYVKVVNLLIIYVSRNSDCGPPAKANPECKVNANATLPYPNCCPIYDCAPGIQLEFPDIPFA